MKATQTVWHLGRTCNWPISSSSQHLVVVVVVVTARVCWARAPAAPKARQPTNALSHTWAPILLSSGTANEKALTLLPLHQLNYLNRATLRHNSHSIVHHHHYNSNTWTTTTTTRTNKLFVRLVLFMCKKTSEKSHQQSINTHTER